jgi:hypothetical protein
MKKILLLLLFLPVQVALYAANLEDFAFDDPDMTDLSEVQNSGTEGTSFAGGIAGAYTDGNGNLRLFDAAGHAALPKETLITSGIRYLVLEDVRFNLPNSTTTGQRDQFGFGYRNRDEPMSDFGVSDADVASFWVGSAANSSDITLEGLTMIGGTISPTVIGDVSDTMSLYDFVLEMNADADTYSISYSKNDDPFINIGSASAVDQDISTIQFIVDLKNNPGVEVPMETIEIGRLYETMVSPVPELSTLLMAGMSLSSLALVVFLRRFR